MFEITQLVTNLFADRTVLVVVYIILILLYFSCFNGDDDAEMMMNECQNVLKETFHMAKLKLDSG